MSRKWNIPLTYEPKIWGVIDGTITQTIRAGRKFAVGDLVAFHGWEGKPYRSKWAHRTGYFRLNWAGNYILSVDGLTPVRPNGQLGTLFEWHNLDELAYEDGIEPPTGAALKKVLLGMHPLKEGETLEAQIIRWDYFSCEGGLDE